jgi:hypothetical protein
MAASSTRRNASVIRADQRNWLQRSIEKYRATQNIDEHAEAVLNRLAKAAAGDDDERVSSSETPYYDTAEAFTSITGYDDHRASAILASCIQCEQERQTFLVRILKEKSIIKQCDEWMKAVASLGRFLKDETKVQGLDDYLHPIVSADKLTALIFIGAEDKARIQTALGNLNSLIGNRRQIAIETPRRLGATQKAKTMKNAETAALGLLAHSVAKITGSPQYAYTIAIAKAALSMPEITVERMREAYRTRRERGDWREPL